MSDKRAAIIQLHRAGKTNSEILKLLKAPRSTVYHTVSRFKELQSTDDRPRSGRPRSSRTPKVINAVKARIRRNPKRSMRAMARDMNVSEKTIRNIVKIDLKMSSFKMQTRQYLTDLQKEKRLARAKILLNKLKAGTDTDEIIFSDEKLFTVESIFNRQNDRVLAKSSADIPDSTRSVFRRQKPSSVMVWAAISKTWKSPIIFVPQGVKVNTNVYIDTILTPALQAAKNTSKTSRSSFNKMVHHHTRPRRHRSGAKTIFQDFGARRFGHLHHQISTRWTFVFGLFRRQMPVLLLMYQWKPLIVLLRRHGRKCPKKPCVK